MNRVRPVNYVTREEFDELVNRQVLVEAVLAQVLEVIDEWEVQEAELEQDEIDNSDQEPNDIEEERFLDFERGGVDVDVDVVGQDLDDIDDGAASEENAPLAVVEGGEPPEADEDALAAQREARRIQKEAAGAEAKAAAAAAPVTLDETPLVPVAEALDPIEAANQNTGVPEEGRTVE